jgi:hypothetical protein
LEKNGSAERVPAIIMLFVSNVQAFLGDKVREHATLKAIILIGSFLLKSLRMIFTGALNPSQWSDVSELAMDLVNNLVQDEGWDHRTQVSPHGAMETRGCTDCIG